MKDFLDNVYSLIKEYGWLLMAGIIGSVIHRMRRNMSWKKFIGNVIVSMCVGLFTGILLQEYFELSDRIIFVCCSITGTFSDLIMEELKDYIKIFSENFKSKIDKK